MDHVVGWVKNYSMVFLLMTVLTSVAAKKEYRKYIQLFVEIILVITLAGPLLGALGKSNDLFEKISYDSFWQGLEGMKLDQEKIDFIQEEAYLSYYEKAIAADVKLMAEEAGYAALAVSVTLSDAFEVEALELEVARRDTEKVIVGTVGEKPESGEITALREKIAAHYQVDAQTVSIVD